MKLYAGKYEITTANGEKQRLTIDRDEFCESPREWDNVAEFVGVGCRRLYDFFDKVVDDSDELAEYLNEVGEHVAMPLYIYEHSGICIHTYRASRWDTSFVGVAVVSKEKALDALNCTVENWEEKAREIINQEIEMLNQYLSGDVYMYVLEQVKKCECCGAEHTEEIESCGGFFGVESIIAELPKEWQTALNDGNITRI